MPGFAAALQVSSEPYVHYVVLTCRTLPICALSWWAVRNFGANLHQPISSAQKRVCRSVIFGDRRYVMPVVDAGLELSLTLARQVILAPSPVSVLAAVRRLALDSTKGTGYGRD